MFKRKGWLVLLFLSLPSGCAWPGEPEFSPCFAGVAGTPKSEPLPSVLGSTAKATLDLLRSRYPAAQVVGFCGLV